MADLKIHLFGTLSKSQNKEKTHSVLCQADGSLRNSHQVWKSMQRFTKQLENKPPSAYLHYCRVNTRKPLSTYHRETCTAIFVSILFTIDKKQNHFCLLRSEQINCHIIKGCKYMKFYLPIMKIKILFITKGLQLKSFVK